MTARELTEDEAARLFAGCKIVELRLSGKGIEDSVRIET